MKNDIENYFNLIDKIGSVKESSPDLTDPGSLKKGERWREHTEEAIAHLRRAGYSL